VRVTFLTGCLEEGKDGVGDYTRLLAEESTRRGASCQVIALADSHVSTPVARVDGAGRIERLRLPHLMPWTARVRSAQQAAAAWAPDWVSLQFVPYSFHRWGLAGSMVRALPRLAAAARVQVMLHEIWIGGHSWCTRAIGASQRRSILRLCRRPERLVHTSNQAYRTMLRDYGVQARLLPLFGSIPIASSDPSGWFAAEMVRAGYDSVAHRRSQCWVFVIFGTLHPVWPPEPLFGRLISACQKAGKRMALVSVGGMRAGEPLWTALEAGYGSRITMLRLGEQPASRISQLLQEVDFGIATTPYGLLGKSATVAAMIDHGLPVVVNREDGPYITADPDSRRSALTIRLDRDLPRRLMTARRLPPRWRLGDVASAWLTDLDAANASVPTCSF
jgi:hypothetical protein